MHRVVASWFGSGLILHRLRGSHRGSGTVGALFAWPVSLGISFYFGWQVHLVATAVVIVLSLWATRKLVETEGDAGWIVIDEAAGVFLATIGLGFFPGGVAAFVVFRAADVFKRAFPGVAQAERLPGAVGITADDLVAGAYGLAAGHLVQAFFAGAA